MLPVSSATQHIVDAHIFAGNRASAVAKLRRTKIGHKVVLRNV
jgi:hypothetical protein